MFQPWASLKTIPEWCRLAKFETVVFFIKVYFTWLQNYLAPLQSPSKSKNGCKAGPKAAEESFSKYIIFCTKFLRCGIETLKKVKAKGNSLDEVTNSLNLGELYVQRKNVYTQFLIAPILQFLGMIRGK